MSDIDKIKGLRESLFDLKAIEETHTAVDNAKRVLNSALHGTCTASDETMDNIKSIHKSLSDLHFDMYDEIHSIRKRADILYNELVKVDE